jgi:hypothetical protein
MTTQSITATEADARIQAFGRALDDLRGEIESRIGAEDAEHILRELRRVAARDAAFAA